jgi:hypothetical protein
MACLRERGSGVGLVVTKHFFELLDPDSRQLLLAPRGYHLSRTPNKRNSLGAPNVRLVIRPCNGPEVNNDHTTVILIP